MASNYDGEELQFFQSLHTYSGLVMNTECVSDGELLKLLTSITEYLKAEESRKTISEESLTDLVSILHKSQNSPDDTGILMVITELFRCLRNACAGCTRNQLLLNRFGTVFEDTIYILSHNLTQEEIGKQVAQLLRCGVQFLGNASAGMQTNADLVWQLIFPKFRDFLMSTDEILCKYSCMLLHTCLNTERCQDLLSMDQGLFIVSAVLELLIKYDVDWGLFIIEKLLICRDFMSRVYQALAEDKRMLVLDIIYSMVEKDSENTHIQQMKPPPLEPQNIAYLAQEFISTAHVILNTSTSTPATNMESSMIMKILDVLCIASFHPAMEVEVQKKSELLKCAINLLHCLHMIGQQGDNAFTSVQKLSDVSHIDHSHPAFGLKKDLIRLVGNMCHRHQYNQDQVREMGGIGLILDHTSIDEKNPYITQWSVFAVHNLCEENMENQAVIAGMNVEGVSNNTELLQQFGINAHIEDNKVVVKKEVGDFMKKQ